MSMKESLSGLPKIQGFHKESIISILQEVTPFVEGVEELKDTLPILKTHSDSTSSSLSLFLLSPYMPHAGKFFYEMMSRWLLPYKRVIVSFFFLSQFTFDCFEDFVGSASQMVLSFSCSEDLEKAQSNLEMLKQEIFLGMQSPYHASRILEMKGLVIDEKRALIQERIAMLMRRFPHRFDYDIFSFMHHFFLVKGTSFMTDREHRQVGHTITMIYLLQKKLLAHIEAFPRRRHLFVKLIKRRLHLPFGTKQVLGVFVGLNFLRENEIFAKKHLVKAVQNTIFSARALKESEYVYKDSEYPLYILYVEMEKAEGDFSLQEMKTLQRELPTDLKGRIEHLLRPIFMPRNEEEIMRNLLTLGRELKFSRDLPQVIIIFDEQTDKELFFRVLIVRVLLPDSLSAETLLSELSVHIEKVKIIGKLRKKHLKQALVVRMSIPLIDFLRQDHSVDLYKARDKILLDLQKALGEVRDYNGGMMMKQKEVFHQLCTLLGEHAIQHRLLLENFFHSLFPVERRSLLDPKKIQRLFLLLLQKVEEVTFEPKKYICKSEEKGDALFMMIEFFDLSFKRRVLEVIDRLEIPPSDLVQLHLQVDERIFLGFMYLSPLVEKRREFVRSIEI
jgi:hypothetical protein